LKKGGEGKGGRRGKEGKEKKKEKKERGREGGERDATNVIYNYTTLFILYCYIVKRKFNLKHINRCTC